MYDIEVWPVGKYKNLPKDFKVAFEKIPGARPLVSYENGKFYSLTYPSAFTYTGEFNELGLPKFKYDPWPAPIKTALAEKDELRIGEDWGVYAYINKEF